MKALEHNKISQEIITSSDKLIESYASSSPQEPTKAFKELLQHATLVGAYHRETWTLDWTNKVWDLFERTPKNLLSLFLNEVKIKQEEYEGPCEALIFIELEILASSDSILLEDKKERCAQLIKEHPLNLEIAHNCIQVISAYEASVEVLKRACFIYEKCIIDWSNDSIRADNLKNKLFNSRNEIFEHYLTNEDLKQAQASLDEIVNSSFLKGSIHFKNITKIQKNRLTDKKSAIDTKEKIAENLQSHIQEQLTIERKKSIEILGVFTAVITFVITATIAATSKSNFPIEVISLTGLTLILFVYLLSHINEKPKNPVKDYRSFIVFLYLAGIVFVNFTDSKKDTLNELSNRVTTDHTIESTDTPRQTSNTEAVPNVTLNDKVKAE